MPSHSLSNHQPQRFPSRSLLGNYRGLPPLPMIEEEKDLFNHYYGCCCGTMLRARSVAGIVLTLMVIVTVRFQNDGGIRVLVEGQTSLLAANTAITAASVKSTNMDSNMDDPPDDASPPSSSLSSLLGASVAASKTRSSTLSSIFAMAKSSTKQNVIQDYIRWGFPVRVQEQGRIPLELGLVHDDSPSPGVPLLFHIPRSGGSTVRDILGHCYGYVQASDYGGLVPTAEQDTDESSSGVEVESQSSQFLRSVTGQQLKPKRIQVIEGTKDETTSNNPPFVNVDMTTPAGIWRAQQQQFHPEQMADFVYTSHLHPTLSLFSNDEDEQQPPRAQARMFTLMRDPMDRALSMFYYLGSTADEQHLSSVSLEMYARSNRLEHNWMVRFLTNELVQDLTLDHLEMAKRILREHCLVGFLDQMEESMDRFESYYFPNTQITNNESEPSPQKECRDRFIHWGWNNRQSYPEIKEHTTAYELLYRKNEYDILLYEYAQNELWYDQGMLVQQKMKEQHEQSTSSNSATIPKNKK
mmetsp:Transcript_21396/g.32976  ORF Transcript_21396/g.32976 Transcript_21396/m.32976 type:complete len:525 (+) Transcript_21396:357-1931(+)